MILKKVIINGEEVFVPVSIEEAKELYYKVDLIFTDEDEEDDFLDMLEDEEDDDYDESEDVFEDGDPSIGENIEKFFYNLGEKIDDCFAEVTKKIKNKKNNDISMIIPYLEKEELHDLVDKIIEGKEELQNISIIEILPHLESDDCDRIFLKSLMENNPKLKSEQIVKYASEKCLDIVVDKYINGELKINNINNLYPYLSGKSIKKLFNYILKSKE